jgi:hypothetical protein
LVEIGWQGFVLPIAFALLALVVALVTGVVLVVLPVVEGELTPALEVVIEVVEAVVVFGAIGAGVPGVVAVVHGDVDVAGLPVPLALVVMLVVPAVGFCVAVLLVLLPGAGAAGIVVGLVLPGIVVVGTDVCGVVVAGCPAVAPPVAALCARATAPANNGAHMIMNIPRMLPPSIFELIQFDARRQC